MPIVVRNGMQYRLEGPYDVPSSGNLIGPVSGSPLDASSTGNTGSWAPTRPEYLAAPGYETYAPTKAYGYSPVGGDWSGGFGPGGFGSGGGGGGGLTSGDFGGGTDTSTLGNALSALSLLGGANSLSGLLTGKSLMEHAGIPNPFNFLGGEGLNLQALNPFSNTPLTALFGAGGRNLGLAASRFPDALAGGVGGSVGIGPSGYLSPDALAGLSNAVAPGSPSLLTGAMPPAPDLAAVPELTDIFTGPKPADLPYQFEINPAAPTFAEQAQAIQALHGGATPSVTSGMTPAEFAGQFQGLPTAGEYGPYYSGIDPTTVYREGLAMESVAPGTVNNTALPAHWAEVEALTGQELPGIGDAVFRAGPNPYDVSLNMTGSGAPAATPTIAQQAVMDLGGIQATGFGPAASGAFLAGPGAGVYGAAGGVAPAFGSAGFNAGAASGLNAGFMAPLGLAMYGMSRMAEDPTADPRMANQLENYFQRALQGPKQEALELENLKQLVFQNPAAIGVMKTAAEGGVPGATHTHGGVNIVPWEGRVPAKFRELLPELEQVAIESNQANYGGMYNIGEQGLMGSPVNPYGENRKPVVIDQAHDAGSYSDSSRREQRSYPDMFQAP